MQCYKFDSLDFESKSLLPHYSQIKKVGIEDNIIASFSHMRRVDDKFIDEIRNAGEDMSTKYAFSEFFDEYDETTKLPKDCLLYTSPSPRDATLSRMPSSA